MAAPYKKIVRLLTLALAIGVVAACGDDDGTGPSEFELVYISGSGQSGVPGTVLSEPLVVAVRSIDSGAWEQGVTVTWRVIEGDGEPTRTSSVTNEDGEATTRIVLGDIEGDLQVRASASGVDPIVIGPITVLPAPSIQSISPSSVDPGDVVEVVVNDLQTGMPIDVLFDGVIGTITDRQDGSPATLSVVVPAPASVCAGTKSVEVRLRTGAYTGPAQTLTVSVPAEPFQVGQVLVMEGSTEVGCAVLPADGGTSRYLLVALSAEFETSAQVEVSLGGSSVMFLRVQGAAAPQPVTFDARLRAIEQQLAALELIEPAAPLRAQALAQPDSGSTRRFWVIKDSDALPDVTEDDYDRVTATLEYIGVHTLLYVDNAAPEAGLSQDDIRDLGELYDRILYLTDVDYFGEPTDVDNNDRVIVLFSPTVNKLTPPDAEGIVVGFFFGIDLFPPSDACPSCEFSNDGELFYGLVPDPAGEFGDVRELEWVRQVLPAVMVHETEHMVNTRFKLFVNDLPYLEELWLSEGLAHMSEELGGDEAYRAGLVDDANDLYWNNFGRSAQFLSDPIASSLTAVEGGGTLGERGAAWLFLRWIAEQYGDFIFRDIVSAPENGVLNIEAQTGEDFFRLFADWAVALWADDRVISNLAERYQFPKWELRTILEDPEQTGVYLLQPVQASFADLKGPGITEFLAASSPFYIELDADGDMSDLQLELSAVANAGLAILRYE
ncbi:MAG: hypothetical protein JSV86_11650 [Gemmatimonadota bacterium]|nr:MAG: hypothetical protein JSV86_11650 [Gemmatimonadota bacterium]